MSAEGLEPFLKEAQGARCLRVELRADGYRQDEAASIVRSFPLSPETDIVKVAGAVMAIGEADSRNLAKGAQRYILLAWSEQGPWGRHTISFGDPVEGYRVPFTEADATNQGLVAEAIRDRQFGQKLMYSAFQLVLNNMSSIIERYATMHDKTEDKYLDAVEAFEQMINDHEGRQLRREELRIKMHTQERMVETVAPLVAPVMNRLFAYATGQKGVLAPEMFDGIADFLMKNENIAFKWVMDLPEEQRPVMFELLKVFEARIDEKKKAAAAEEARRARITGEQNGAMKQLDGQKDKKKGDKPEASP